MMNKVAVWGGGIVAMLTALLLKKNHYEVALWRPKLQKIIGENKRVFALNNASIALLKTFDIDVKRLQHAQQPIKKMLIWDGLSHAQLTFNASDIGQSYLAIIVEEQTLWDACWQKIQEQRIAFFEACSTQYALIQKDQWVLNLGDGREVWANFLCIADGQHSAVRQYLKVPCEQGSYEQLGLVAEIEVSKPHAGQALQRFGAEGPLAFLPLAESHRYSMVWSLNTTVAKKYLAFDENTFLQTLKQAWEGDVGDILSMKGLKSFPLNYLHVKQYYGPNWLLLGDAAHHFHPLAGLGLNTGLADIICLQKLLAEKTNALWQPPCLARYQRERKSKVMPLILGIQFIKNSFGNQGRFWVKLRSFGMDWLNHQSFIKKIMISLVQNL